MFGLYNLSDKRIINVSSIIKQKFKKLYIAYKAEANLLIYYHKNPDLDFQ